MRAGDGAGVIPGILVHTSELPDPDDENPGAQAQGGLPFKALAPDGQA